MSKKNKFVKWVERSVLAEYGENSYFSSDPCFMDDPIKLEFEVEVPEPTIVYVPDENGTFVRSAANKGVGMVHWYPTDGAKQRYRREERHE